MSPAGFPGLGASTNWPEIYGIAVHISLPERDPPGPPWADLLFASTRDTAYGSFVLRLRHGATRGPHSPACPRARRAAASSPHARGCSCSGDELALPGLLTLSYAVRWGPWTNAADVMVGTRTLAIPRWSDTTRSAALPGIQQFSVVRRLRKPAYRAARASPSSSTSTGRLCK